MAKKQSRSTKAIPKDESKAARFIRVVTPRVAKAVKAITVIGYCAGAPYEYNQKQLEQIVGALTDAQNELIAKFAGKKSAEEAFSFDAK